VGKFSKKFPRLRKLDHFTGRFCTSVYVGKLMNIFNKVPLMRVIDFSQVDFLMDLCSHMKYIKVNCCNGTDLQVLVRFILTKEIKQNMHLISLCLCIHPVNNETIQGLQKMGDTTFPRRHFRARHLRGTRM
jgi:hypothetical protein